MRIKNLEEFRKWVDVYFNRQGYRSYTETYCKGRLLYISIPGTSYMFVFEYDEEDVQV